jgi:hypothetical protein
MEKRPRSQDPTDPSLINFDLGKKKEEKRQAKKEKEREVIAG